MIVIIGRDKRFRGQQMIVKLKNRKSIQYLVTIIIVFFVILWAFTGDIVIQGLGVNVDYETWSEGWSQIIGGEAVELADISDFEAVGVGETLILESQLPYELYNQVLYFYSKDLEVYVYVDDELIYSFVMQDEFELLKTPGVSRNMIELPSEFSGGTLRIELTSQFSNRFMNTVSGIYLVDSGQARNIYLQQNRVYIIMVIILFMMTFVSWVEALLWERKEIKRYFISLGTLYGSILLWSLGMSGLLDYIWHRPIVSYILSMLCVLVMPVIAYEFINIIYNKPSKLLRVFAIIVWGNFYLQIVLQFLFGISFMDMLSISYIVYTLGALSVLYLEIEHLRTCNNKDEINWQFVSTFIILLGILVEIAVLVLLPKRTDLIGVAGLLGTFLYLNVNQFIIIRREAKTDSEKLILEKHYNQLQNTTLVQQINAHFIFNTLNTISALCKHDAKEADRAIRLFATYMRSYMHLIAGRENISFTEELKLVQSTLEIEKLRFPDSFHYSFDLSYSEFELPPLSIQVLVENAIIHGLRSKSGKGHVTVTTRREEDRIQIIVEDSGSGFDLQKLEGKESIGLINLKKRIELMSKGTLVIESIVGEGTKAIIEIPVE